MPAGSGTIGRMVIFKWNGAVIPGVREKGIACAGDPINVSDDDADGVRQLLSEAGEDTVDVSLSGVTKSKVLKIAWFNRQRIGAVEMTYPDGSILAGDFYLASYNETDPYNDAETFEGALQNTGPVTFTPGP